MPAASRAANPRSISILFTYSLAFSAPLRFASLWIALHAFSD
ncbi:MAG: hypothetical protein RL701_249 [Pseudomonadota bacterium]|jgi:hypothetical protein